MQYDLLIKNGTVIDGSGMPRYRADVGISNGKIASIGKIREQAKAVIDAEGYIVSPGFVDCHTHMDAQVAWDPLGTCSCWHGVTSVVMGNCGFTLAPCKEEEKHLVMRNLERAEDISPAAMEAGIDWNWETFPEFLDTLEDLPKGINYAGYIGHSALRTFAMGERAFEEEATEDDMKVMRRQLRDAIRAGAIGLSTSRTSNHQTPDDGPVASRLASWQEVRDLVRVMGDMNAGIFEIAGENPGRNPARIADYFGRLRDLAVDFGRPVTWGIFGTRLAPEYWRQYFDLLEETAVAGGRMFAQVHSRALNVLLSFESSMPFDKWPLWSDVRALCKEEQMQALLDQETRQKLIEVASRPYEGRKVRGAEPRPPEYDWVYVMNDMIGPHKTVAEVAKERGVHPVEAMIDLALEKDFKQFFQQPLANENQDHVLEMMKNPRSVVTFSDSGAHVSQIMDSSLQTHVLSYWVRHKQALTLEEGIKMITFEPASHWGFHDRGLLREGWAADVVVFDPEKIVPLMPEVVYDLPAGARRLKQKSEGIAATVVNGEVLMRDNEHTGALPGKLLRGPLTRR